ncbi:Predicted methyltransferase [Pseudidiomarina planktonica]|uniref:Predicted methyltransferase n=1 Tax=Pseudidiomarina planktonica TaxID=1323738 RepID=A0A1Y6FWG1_9GAMM|nr:class I SAM-dependent methyltransferase [Pseudidiomarina planktonica]RUO63819.1 methyltransferase domain-containing protein [Pseudidiomarina planktonica]SMQ80116.1 Predicted methyltransferase [Pseudidiomarina planktonica]
MTALTKFYTTALVAALSFSFSGSALADHHNSDPKLLEAVNADVRSDKNKARDEFRNPADTLAFFGIQPDMTVVEISPGGGWYTEILAPYLKENGKLYAAHFPASSEREYYQRSRANFVERVENEPAFSEIVVTDFAPDKEYEVAPAGSADMVLTFRNLHNWYMQGGEDGVKNAFTSFYKALKPGGVLGVVDHRLPETRSDEAAKESGYMKESWAVQYAEAVGFELIGSSDVNANPNDTADYPRGVWSLPPTLALGEEDRDKYLAIGESDRFTLKFVKPELP